jgi:hypothetical protein
MAGRRFLRYAPGNLPIYLAVDIESTDVLPRVLTAMGELHAKIRDQGDLPG